MHRQFLIFRLVLRADDIQSIKKYPFLKRKFFVTVSSSETTVKTTDVRIEGHMAKWNQSLDALYALRRFLQFNDL